MYEQYTLESCHPDLRTLGGLVGEMVQKADVITRDIDQNEEAYFIESNAALQSAWEPMKQMLSNVEEKVETCQQPRCRLHHCKAQALKKPKLLKNALLPMFTVSPHAHGMCRQGVW